MIDGKQLEQLEDKFRKLDVLLTYAFKLPAHSLTFAPINNMGECTDNNHINVRVVNTKHTGFLAESTILDTLCHELAHLMRFDHSAKHRRLTIAMKEWALINGY